MQSFSKITSLQNQISVSCKMFYSRRRRAKLFKQTCCVRCLVLLALQQLFIMIHNLSCKWSLIHLFKHKTIVYSRLCSASVMLLAKQQDMTSDNNMLNHRMSGPKLSLHYYRNDDRTTPNSALHESQMINNNSTGKQNHILKSALIAEGKSC